MKLSFLLRQESPARGGTSFYDFLPYHFGPYSFMLNHELQHLSRDGLVDFDGQFRLATRNPKSCAPNHLPLRLAHDVDWVLEEYGAMSTTDLLDYVYQAYPWFTVNSSQLEQRRGQRPQAPLAIYTAGYEKQTIDGFLNLLLEAGIGRIIDVRHNPVSRRYGFHGSSLMRLSQGLAFEYYHLPNLGIPSHQRRTEEAERKPDSLFDLYRDEILPLYPNELRRLARLVSNRASVLVCMEADPAKCHRSHLASVLIQEAELPIVHLGWPR